MSEGISGSLVVDFYLSNISTLLEDFSSQDLRGTIQDTFEDFNHALEDIFISRESLKSKFLCRLIV